MKNYEDFKAMLGAKLMKYIAMPLARRVLEWAGYTPPEQQQEDYFGSQTFFEDFLAGVQEDLGDEFNLDREDWSVEFFNGEEGKYIVRFYAAINSETGEKVSNVAEEPSDDEVDKEFHGVLKNFKQLSQLEEAARQRKMVDRKKGK